MESKSWVKDFKANILDQAFEPEEEPRFSEKEMHDFLKKAGTFAGLLSVALIVVILLLFT